jgi:hypothetical protein
MMVPDQLSARALLETRPKTHCLFHPLVPLPRMLLVSGMLESGKSRISGISRSLRPCEKCDRPLALVQELGNSVRSCNSNVVGMASRPTFCSLWKRDHKVAPTERLTSFSRAGKTRRKTFGFSSTLKNLVSLCLGGDALRLRFEGTVRMLLSGIHLPPQP